MKEQGRILGLDYGTKTLGVAISDPLLLTARALEIIKRNKPTKLRRTLARVEELIKEYQIEKLVLGYPRHMDGTEGIRCQKTQEFRQLLQKRTGLEVILWDERLTTVEAGELMAEAGIAPEKYKEYVDKVAAMVILQDYLNALSEK